MSGSLLGQALSTVGFGDFCAFGNISFALLGSPEKIRRQRKSHYAKLPILTGSPVLQWTYDDLEQIHIEIKFHEMWLGPGGPDRALALLEQSRRAHQPQPLVFGCAGLPEGQYVIIGLEEADGWRYAGVAQWIEAKLSLEEWQPTSPAGLPGQRVEPAPGTIGMPSGFAALYAVGSGIGLLQPGSDFTSVPASAIARAGAP